MLLVLILVLLLLGGGGGYYGYSRWGTGGGRRSCVLEVVRPGRSSDEALKESDGILLYHGLSNDIWFETKLRTVSSAPRRAIKAAWTVAPPAKETARRMAQEAKFRLPPEVDRADPRILMDGDNLENVESFLSVLRS